MVTVNAEVEKIASGCGGCIFVAFTSIRSLQPKLRLKLFSFYKSVKKSLMILIQFFLPGHTASVQHCHFQHGVGDFSILDVLSSDI